MKKLILLILIIIANTAISQTTNLSPQMVNTAGGSGVVAGVYYDYTVGEPVTLFGGPACDSIFSGFQHCAIDTFSIKKVTAATSGLTTFCLGGDVNITAPSGISYLWNNNATTQTISATQSGNYSVRITNSCGDTIRSKTITVTTLNPPTPSICMATVDSLSQFNIIYWDKTPFAGGEVDTFVVYRDIANNNYAPIGKVPYDSLSQFTDTVRSRYAANGDPNASSWRYKISAIDSCGNEGAKSPYHQTVFIQNTGGNFSWNQYLIEGQITPVPALSNYLFLRDNTSTGNYLTIQTLSASSTAYTDGQYTIYQATGAWRVKTNWAISCEPTRGTIITTRSNIKTSAITTSVANNTMDQMQISPNPASEAITIQCPGGYKKLNLQVFDALGQLVYNEQLSGDGSSKAILTKQLDVSTFKKGIYIVNIQTEYGNTFKRVAVQ